MNVEKKIVLLLSISLLFLCVIYVAFGDRRDVSFEGEVLATYDLGEEGCILYVRTDRSIEKIFISPNLLNEVKSLDVGCEVIVDGSVINFKGKREILATHISCTNATKILS